MTTKGLADEKGNMLCKEGIDPLRVARVVGRVSVVLPPLVEVRRRLFGAAHRDADEAAPPDVQPGALVLLGDALI